MLSLILSTDGTARKTYLSADDIEVPTVEEIRHTRTVFGPPEYHQRDTVHVALTPEQAVGIAIQLLASASK